MNLKVNILLGGNMIRLMHRKFGKPSFITAPDVVEYEDYYDVATFNLDADDLEDVWTRTQNGLTEHHWSVTAKAQVLFPMERHFYNYDETFRRHRSSAVGDILLKNGEWWIIDMVGFKPVEVRMKLDDKVNRRNK
jgi:hypothetical protein